MLDSYFEWSHLRDLIGSSLVASCEADHVASDASAFAATQSALPLPWQQNPHSSIDSDAAVVVDDNDRSTESPPTSTTANRLIFAVHPGASGAGYLAELLGTADERNRALHIPTALAMGDEVMVESRSRPLAETFEQRRMKAERIDQAFNNFLAPSGVYIETNPRFIFTFFDVIVDRFVQRGWAVDIVVLQRHFGRTLKSLVERGYYTRNPATPTEVMSAFAVERALEPPLNSTEMDEYDELIAYMFDVYARGERLAKQLKSFANVRFIPLRFESLLSLGGAKAAFRALNLTWSARSEAFVLDSPIVDEQFDLVARYGIDTTLEYCEQRIDAYVARCGAACPDIGSQRLEHKLRAAQVLAPFVDTFTSIERAERDLRTAVVTVRFADAAVQTLFDARRHSSTLPAFVELPQHLARAPPAAPVVVCIQFCLALSPSVTAAQLQRLRQGTLCDKVIALAMGGGDAEDELRWHADVVARVSVPRLNRERDTNIALTLARFVNATHVVFIERDIVLSPSCTTERQAVLALRAGAAARLAMGVLVLAIADDAFVGINERSAPLNWADAPLSIVPTATLAVADAAACYGRRLDESIEYQRMQKAWLEIFSTIYRVELTETAQRELVDEATTPTPRVADIQAISMMREFGEVQAERRLRQEMATRWLTQIAAQQQWLNVNNEQLAEWRALFAVDDATTNSAMDD
jgi:hypothetical protein